MTVRGPKSPKTPNRHFKPNMRKIQTDLCIRLTSHLIGSCGQQHRFRGWSRMMENQFQDGGRPPFWKSIYRHISVNKKLSYCWQTAWCCFVKLLRYCRTFCLTRKVWLPDDEKNSKIMFVRFDMIHERDRRTDSQTDGRTDRHRMTA